MKKRRQKTDEEYHAVAMLLGYTYDPEYHVFRVVEEGQWKWKHTHYHDPDTMERMDPRFVTGRRWRFRNAKP